MEKDINKQILIMILFIQTDLLRLDIIEKIKPIVTVEDLELWKSKLNTSKDKEETLCLRINLTINMMLNDRINIKEVKII